MMEWVNKKGGVCVDKDQGQMCAREKCGWGCIVFRFADLSVWSDHAVVNRNHSAAAVGRWQQR